MEHTANIEETDTGLRSQYATFFLDQLFLGIEVEHVQEVSRQQTLTPVPLAPRTIKGLINLRGQIVTAIDMRAVFGLSPRSSEFSGMNVVVRTPEGAVNFIVDQIGDVLNLEGSTFEQTPSSLTELQRSLIKGVYKLPKGLLLVVDLERALGID
jgi:purine-binding chemotaxis protein CheW